MSKLKEDLVPFIKANEIQELVSTIARQIEVDYNGQGISFVCPLKGSVHFCADLMRELKLFQQVDFVQLQPISKGGGVSIVKDVSINLMNKHILIVEEIIDTGRTLKFLQNHLLASLPASLKIVALLDKPARRELPIRADYVGKTIDDRYVVGYGMDLDGIGRNYPDIYFLKN